MSEQMDNRYFSHNHEDLADAEIFKGDIASARQILIDGIEFDYINNPDAYHHLSLKACALPFYEMIHTGKTDELIADGESAYGMFGNLLETQLDELDLTPQGSPEAPRLFGSISETVVLALLARDFTEDSTHVPVPATRTADKAGTDIVLFPIKGMGIGSVRIQVKSRVTPDDIQRYDTAQVGLVGLNEIDPFYKYPLLQDSLARRIVRELDGRATDQDTVILDHAISRIYHLAQSNRTAQLQA